MGFNLIRKTAPIAPEDRRPAKTERNQMIMVARSAYDKWRHSFYSCAERTAASALRKRGKKNGRRMRRRKRGRELVRVAFQAQAVGRSPTFSPCGHFWHHLLVTKGGKDFLAGNSRKVGMFPTLSQPDSVKKYAFSAAAEERQPAAARCGGLHRPACGLRHILRRPRVDKRR